MNEQSPVSGTISHVVEVLAATLFPWRALRKLREASQIVQLSAVAFDDATTELTLQIGKLERDIKASRK